MRVIVEPIPEGELWEDMVMSEEEDLSDEGEEVNEE
jgi:hypothetical protein